MPELPEVETVVRGLRDAGLEGLRIENASVLWHKSAGPMSPQAFVERLRGQRFSALERRAKYIVCTLAAGDTLLIHLRMTGQIRIQPASEPTDPHDRLLLDLSDGRRLHFRDTRKFGRFTLTDTPDAILGKLGPEPLDDAFSLACLRGRLANRRRMLKPLLLDQTVVAGLGNIYVDEALFQAGLHPEAQADTLDDTDLRRLRRAIRAVLHQGVRTMGTTLGTGRTNFYSVAGRRGRNADKLKVFRRTGEPCPTCRTPIERLIVGQRSSHICPVCQPPRPLA